jgi:hypothetical protein
MSNRLISLGIFLTAHQIQFGLKLCIANYFNYFYLHDTIFVVNHIFSFLITIKTSFQTSCNGRSCAFEVFYNKYTQEYFYISTKELLHKPVLIS